MPLLVFSLPFLFFHWMMPFVSDVIPGRDFIQYYIWLQMEFMAAVKAGTFPLYLHTDFNGLPGYILTAYSHMYLPFPYIASLLPGYWTGLAADWGLLLLLLSIPLAHWALFVFVRKTGVAAGVAFFLSTLTAYSPRILPGFFYGPGIASWIGHILLCACIGLYYIKPTPKKGPLLIIIATYLLANSGQPEEIFYGFLNAGVMTLVLPYLLPAVMADHSKTDRSLVFRFWGKTAGWFLIGLALSSANLLPAYFDLVRNMAFSNQDYAWASRSAVIVTGFINNFFSPLRASVMCSFCGAPVYLMVILIPLLTLFKIRVPKPIWILLGVIVFALLHMLGALTPVHYYFWKYFPLASSIRFPARISFLLPMQFLLVFLWLFQTPQVVEINNTARRIRITPLAFLAVVSIILFIIYPFTGLVNPDRLFIAPAFNLTIIPKWVEPFILINGGILLVVLAVWRQLPKAKKTASTLASVLLCLHLLVLLEYYPSQSEQKNPEDTKTYDVIVEEKTKNIRILSDHIFILENFLNLDAVEQATRYFLPPGLGSVYRNVMFARNRAHAYELLNNNRRQDELVVEKVPHNSIEFLCVEEQPACAGKTDSVTLVYSSYNRLQYQTVACQPACFFFPLPFTEQNHWQAFVNNKKTAVFRANGFGCAVLIPRGSSTVEFRYRSAAAVWGMAISCMALACLGLWLGRSVTQNKTAGYAVAGTVPILAAVLFFSWFHGLYSGDSFHAEYEWVSPSSDRLRNLAFGKRTIMSSHSQRDPYTHPSRRGVDGDRSLATCFITGNQPSPWWEVDLGAPVSTGGVDIYASLQGYEFDTMIPYYPDSCLMKGFNNRFVIEERPVLYNQTPLTIALSSDRREWELAEIYHLQKDGATHVRFPENKTIRYLKIIASGKCRLCLNEIEIYPPVFNAEKQ